MGLAGGLAGEGEVEEWGEVGEQSETRALGPRRGRCVAINLAPWLMWMRSARSGDFNWSSKLLQSRICRQLSVQRQQKRQNKTVSRWAVLNLNKKHINWGAAPAAGQTAGQADEQREILRNTTKREKDRRLGNGINAQGMTCALPSQCSHSEIATRIKKQQLRASLSRNVARLLRSRI